MQELLLLIYSFTFYENIIYQESHEGETPAALCVKKVEILFRNKK